mmetsp:Transcript_17816/g.48118  ORF Transcript_17816/g.48118 Transcript_17816/m.48118 type:complete len:207 (-) Transcript_17816:1040-1660(-)
MRSSPPCGAIWQPCVRRTPHPTGRAEAGGHRQRSSSFPRRSSRRSASATPRSTGASPATQSAGLQAPRPACGRRRRCTSPCRRPAPRRDKRRAAGPPRRAHGAGGSSRGSMAARWEGLSLPAACLRSARGPTTYRGRSRHSRTAAATSAGRSLRGAEDCGSRRRTRAARRASARAAGTAAAPTSPPPRSFPSATTRRRSRRRRPRW